jgi:hypothetical protein
MRGIRDESMRAVTALPDWKRSELLLAEKTNVGQVLAIANRARFRIGHRSTYFLDTLRQREYKNTDMA